MRALPVTRIRLERALPLHRLLNICVRGGGRRGFASAVACAAGSSIVANGFRECQCEVGCVRVGVLRDTKIYQTSWAFGLSPEFSTPVEKTVENPPE